MDLVKGSLWHVISSLRMQQLASFFARKMKIISYLERKARPVISPILATFFGGPNRTEFFPNLGIGRVVQVFDLVFNPGLPSILPQFPNSEVFFIILRNALKYP